MKHIITFLILAFSVTIYGQKRINDTIIVNKIKVDREPENNVILAGGNTKALAPENGGAFNGVLFFDNVFGRYQNDYDNSISGEITFSVDSTLIVNNASVSFKYIADGTTALMTTANRDEIFRARTGLPENLIFAAGTYEIFCYHTNNGAGIVATEWTTAPTNGGGSEMPFAADAVFYVDAKLDTPTLAGNDVVSIPNRANDVLVENTTGANRPTWNATDQTIVFDAAGEFIRQADNFYDRGDHTIVMSYKINSATSAEANFSTYWTGSLNRNVIDHPASDFSNIRFYNQQSINVPNQIPLSGGAGVDAFNDTVYLVAVFNVSTTSVTLYARGTNITGTYERSENLQASSVVDTRPVNQLALEDAGLEIEIDAFATINRVLNASEAAQVLDFFQNR
jgi:hypothetical protein